MHIEEATENQINIIRHIAYKTWPVVYRDILPKPQLHYMLELFYSEQALTRNIEAGHIFLLVWDDQEAVAFAGIEHDYQTRAVTRIHKIYVLPEAQRRGAGQLLMDHIEVLARKHGSKSLSLNVNRNNDAQQFYLRNEFINVGEEDVPLEHGYLMEDYVMEKRI